MSEESEKAPIKVALEGFSERSTKALASIFQRHYGGRFIIVSATHARVAVLKVEGVEALRNWREFRQRHPDLGVVVVADEPPDIGSVNYVPIPISVARLKRALELAAMGETTVPDADAAHRLRARSDKPRASVRKSAKKPSVAARRAPQVRAAIDKQVHYPTETCFLGQLTRAIARNPGMAISMPCLSDYIVVADATAGTLFSDLPDSRLRHLAEDSSARYIAGEATTMASGISAGSLATGSKPLKCHALEAFMWDLAVRTSRGRVPEGTLLDVPVYLSRWPNFTRLAPIPEALRVSAVWVRQPRSLVNLYETLKVPIEHVFTLYSAAHAIGLAGVGKREVDGLLEPTAIDESGNEGLFGSILRKLTGRAIEA